MQLSVLDVFNQQYSVVDEAIEEIRKRSHGIKRLRVAITGIDHEVIARTALALMDENHQVILLPKPGMQFPSDGIDVTLTLNRSSISIDTPSMNTEFKNAARLWEHGISNEWDVVMYTSGTTGSAKPIALSRNHLDYTIARYKEIYGTDENTLILSALPASYNFTFISAAYQSKMNGHDFRIVNEYSIVPEIKKAKNTHSKVIVVANPIILQLISDSMKDIDTNLLVDSGGSPLSNTATRLFREAGIDIREGYGLTETSSLTHFDKEGNEESMGTVGTPMQGVSTYIKKNPEGNPILVVQSPNIGVNLMDNPLAWPKEVNTGDVVRIDGNDRIRLLGRERDNAINGQWPRDTLDLIGPVLGQRCAGIRHFPDDRIWIRVLGDIDDKIRNQLTERVLDTLAIPPESLYIDAYSDALLHSVKLPAPEM